MKLEMKKERKYDLNPLEWSDVFALINFSQEKQAILHVLRSTLLNVDHCDLKT